MFIAAALPFLRAVHYGIVNLDDYFYVAWHDPVIGGLGWDGVSFAFTSLEDGIWMPLTWLSYMFDWSLAGLLHGNCGTFEGLQGGGAVAGIMHLHSILIHAVNAMLVWRVLCAVAESGACWLAGDDLKQWRVRSLPLVAALAAVIWAVHPLRCESVAFIASRKDVLSLFWMLLAMLAWFRFQRGGRCRVTYAASMLFFVLGALAKPSVMTFPVLCFIVDFFIRRRVRPFDYALPLAMAAALGWFAGYAQAVGGAMLNSMGVPYWYRLVNAAAAFGLYLWNVVWPRDLAPQCVLMWPGWPRFCVPGIAICAVVCGWIAFRALRFRERFSKLVDTSWHGLALEWRPKGGAEPVFAGIVWFAVAIAPMLGVVGFGYHSLADRFTYIPAIGLSISVMGLMLRTGRARRACLSALAAVAVLSAMAWWQTGFWRDDHSLFTHTLEVDGDRNATAHLLLAYWYFEFPHDLTKSVEHFEKAIAVSRRQVEKRFEIYVFALCELGRESEVPPLLKEYDAWIRKDAEDNPKFGKDSPRTKAMRVAYFISRIAYLITQPDLRKAAREELYGNQSLGCYPGALYLKWRLAIAEGDETGAKAAQCNLLEKVSKKGYIQFRYLRDGGRSTRGADSSSSPSPTRTIRPH